MKPEKLYLSGAALAVAALILLLPTYYVGLLTLAGTNALVCLGLAFLLAAGQLSLGHAAFLGGGAHASAILARDFTACRRRWPSPWRWRRARPLPM